MDNVNKHMNFFISYERIYRIISAKRYMYAIYFGICGIELKASYLFLSKLC